MYSTQKALLTYINIIPHVANCNNATAYLLSRWSAREILFIALWLTLHLQQIAELGYTIVGVTTRWQDDIEACARAQACTRFAPKQRKRNFNFYSSARAAQPVPLMYAFIAVLGALHVL